MSLINFTCVPDVYGKQEELFFEVINNLKITAEESNNDVGDTVIILVNHVNFRIPKFVLTSFSGYFKKMFENDYIESKQNIIKLGNIEVETLDLLFNYAISGSITINISNCQNLIAASCYLDVIPVREAATKFLTCHLDADNCLGIWHFAEFYNCWNLRQKAFHFALRYFWEVSQKEEFLDLTSDQLIELLDNNNLKIEKEDIAFLAVKKWFNDNPKERCNDFQKVLQHVRLRLVESSLLEDSLHFFMGISGFNRECIQMIKSAKCDCALSTDNEDEKHRRNYCFTIDVVVIIIDRHVSCFCPSSNEFYALSGLPDNNCNGYISVVISEKNELYATEKQCAKGSTNKVWRYDTVLDVWQEVPSFSVRRINFGLLNLDSYIYAIGGDYGNTKSTIERYDSKMNCWFIVNQLPSLIHNVIAIAVDEKIYVSGTSSPVPLETLRNRSYLRDIHLCYNYDSRIDSCTELTSSVILKDCYFDEMNAFPDEPYIGYINGIIFPRAGCPPDIIRTQYQYQYKICNHSVEDVTFSPSSELFASMAIIDGKLYLFGNGYPGNDHENILKCKGFHMVYPVPVPVKYYNCTSLKIEEILLSTNKKLPLLTKANTV